MPKVRGTLDGQRFDDLRTLVPQSIKDYYVRQRLWEAVQGVRFPTSQNTDSVVITFIRSGCVQKHKWHRKDRLWQIVDHEVL